MAYFLVNPVQKFHELYFFVLCNKNKKWRYWFMQCFLGKERKLCSVNAIERKFAILLSVKPENLKITIGFVCFLCTQKRLVRAVEKVLHLCILTCLVSLFSSLT